LGKAFTCELKKLVVQKLVDQGEVCRANLLAENLIIKEIADQLNRCGKKNPVRIVVTQQRFCMEFIPE
jgi:hypothetical protein